MRSKNIGKNGQRDKSGASREKDQIREAAEKRSEIPRVVSLESETVAMR